MRRATLKALYLSWVNDFLTVSAFAAYHGINEDHATDLINMGRQYHNEDAR